MYQNSSIEIIYGTGNKAKVEAMKKIIREHDFNVSIQTLKDINFNEEIIEDGKTFEENSEIKARVIQKFCEKNNIKNKIIITDKIKLACQPLSLYNFSFIYIHAYKFLFIGVYNKRLFITITI